MGKFSALLWLQLHSGKTPLRSSPALGPCPSSLCHAWKNLKLSEISKFSISKVERRETFLLKMWNSQISLGNLRLKSIKQVKYIYWLKSCIFWPFKMTLKMLKLKINIICNISKDILPVEKIKEALNNSVYV